METLNRWQDRVAQAMQDVQGTGTFAVQGDLNLPDPGLAVDAVGAIPVPIRAADARRLIAVAKQAPFGRGTQTVVDTAVRRCWELDPQQFRLTAEDWPDIESILAGGVAFELGFSEPLFEASLYKLLIYEKDSFFLPHQDGEKSDGMVATLVVTLPGSFVGGELVIEHQGRELVCPAAAASAGTSASYAAFYSDCRHEVRKLRSGYRVCLVYNLSIRRGLARKCGVPAHLSAATQTDSVQRLTEVLSQWNRDPDAERPNWIALPLEHQYSQAGLSLDTLKGNDRFRVEAIATVAKQLDLVAHVCLLTWHQSGAGNYADGCWPDHDYSRRRRYGRYDDYFDDEYDEDEEDDDEEDDNEESLIATEEVDAQEPKPSRYEMEEIYEEERSIEYWLDIRTGRQVALGSIPITPEAIADEDDPDQWLRTGEEFEGYTGNAGMTLDRWYSRAAVVLWPRRLHYRILTEAGTSASLGGLQSMVTAARSKKGARRQAALAECAVFAREIISRWPDSQSDYRSLSTSSPSEDGPDPLTLIAEIEDIELFNEFLRSIPFKAEGIDLSGFPEAARRFGWDASAEAMQQVFERDQSRSLTQNLAALAAIVADRDNSLQKLELAARLTKTWLAAVKRYDSGKQPPYWSSERFDRRSAMVTMVELCLAGKLHEGLAEFLNHTLELLEQYGLRDVHAAALKDLQPKLAKAKLPEPVIRWLRQLEKHFGRLTQQPPTAPADFRRNAAVGCSCADCRRLAAFLEDASREVLELPLASERRRHLHGQIESKKLDVTHVTRRSGRPYVLVCKKTTDSYHRELKTYHEDLETLQMIRQLCE